MHNHGLPKVVMIMKWRMICYHLNKKCSRNIQVEIREPEENYFVSDDAKDDLDKDVDIELKSNKELDKS